VVFFVFMVEVPFPQEFDPLTEFEKHRPDLSAEVVGALNNLGPEAVQAYASVGLYHNTLDTFVPSIMEEGLHATSESATPDPSDIAFAEELFKRKGMYEPGAAKRFGIYIKGKRDDGEPGIYFYGRTASENSAAEYNKGYGQPERLLIFAQEMAAVMALVQDYTVEERHKARELFDKYSAIANRGGHVAVLRANPFSPAIFNQRLAGLPYLATPDSHRIIETLKVLDLNRSDDIYIHGSVPPADLQLMDVQLPTPVTVGPDIDPTRSRFFYVPQHLRRV
jgi:hypothetical protein